MARRARRPEGGRLDRGPHALPRRGAASEVARSRGRPRRAGPGPRRRRHEAARGRLHPPGPYSDEEAVDSLNVAMAAGIALYEWRHVPMSEIWWDVVGVGENSMDHVLRLPKLPTRPRPPRWRSAPRARARGPGGHHPVHVRGDGLRAGYIGAFGSDDDGERLRGRSPARGLISPERRAAGGQPLRRHSGGRAHRRSGGDGPPRRALALVPEALPRSTLTGARGARGRRGRSGGVSAAHRARQRAVTCDLEGIGARTGEFLRELTVRIWRRGCPRPSPAIRPAALRRLDAPAARRGGAAPAPDRARR